MRPQSSYRRCSRRIFPSRVEFEGVGMGVVRAPDCSEPLYRYITSSIELETGDLGAFYPPCRPCPHGTWHLLMHVCTIHHAKGQAEGTMLTLCSVLLCNLSLQLTLVSILQVSAVLSVLSERKCRVANMCYGHVHARSCDVFCSRCE